MSVIAICDFHGSEKPQAPWVEGEAGTAIKLVCSGVSQQWGRPPPSLAGHTIPEAEQLADAPADSHAMASLLNSFQTMGLISDQHTTSAQAGAHSQAVAGQTHMSSPFASPEHAPPLDFSEGGDGKSFGRRRMGTQGSAHAGQLSGGTLSHASSSSSGAGGLASKTSPGLISHTPFASASQQLHKMSSASSMGSGPGRSPSGRTSQIPSRQASSPAAHSPKAAAT